MLRLHHALNRRAQFVAYRRVLRFQVKQRDVHFAFRTSEVIFRRCVSELTGCPFRRIDCCARFEAGGRRARQNARPLAASGVR